MCICNIGKDCDQCHGGKDPNTLTNCFKEGVFVKKLCQVCIEGTNYCLSCGEYKSPNNLYHQYCGDCINQFEDDYDESEGFLDCPKCGREYDEIDYEYQICSNCGWNEPEKKFGKPNRRSNPADL